MNNYTKKEVLDTLWDMIAFCSGEKSDCETCPLKDVCTKWGNGEYASLKY